jgi:deazaflavin-dependent oxidoreductase (nitroreductase family)
MASQLSERLGKVAGYQTLRLTHHGRKSGKPYEVTIWFVVEGDTIYLMTADASRQWPRNVKARPQIAIKIGAENFSGEASALESDADRARVFQMAGRKYWYALPYMWIGRMLTQVGLIPDRTGAFKVRLDPGA